MVTGESRWRPPPTLWIPIAVFLGLLFFADVYQQQYYALAPTTVLEPLLPRAPDRRAGNLKGFLVNTEGCRIPAMDPFDRSILGFIKPMRHPPCNAGLPPLVEANLTSLFVVKAALGRYNASEEGLRCCYRPFWRVEPREEESDKMVRYAEECVGFGGSADVEEEYVKVECHWNDTLIYTDLFAFVPIEDVTKAAEPRPLNILIIGVDTVSRLNLHRQLPRTLKYLKRLGLVEFFGYNKIADNTFPNLMPVLTGHDEDELKRICWPTTTSKFDDCPFLWDRFRAKGYKTAYAEDAAWMGIFNYVKRGFRRQPTDYYWSFFNRLAEEVIGNQHDMNVKRCVGPRRVYSTMLDYLKRFVATMRAHDQPYFGFFWEVSLSHDYLNAPKMADGEFEALFAFLNDSGELNQTALFFMSDHGMRWGGIRSTFQGQMEERLPFLTVLLPRWYQKARPAAFLNLQRNTRSLTTPFDLHETLKDLLEPFAAGAATSALSRGYSLFGRIPSNRTCEDAAIPSHFCTCQQSAPVDGNETVVREAAGFAVDYMNALLEGWKVCANLTLSRVVRARVLRQNEKVVERFREYEDYMVTLETAPGGGLFEVTVRRHARARGFEITGTVSRINLYGDQSKCVSDFHMKLYCYCKYLLR